MVNQNSNAAAFELDFQIMAYFGRKYKQVKIELFLKGNLEGQSCKIPSPVSQPHLQTPLRQYCTHRSHQSLMNLFILKTPLSHGESLRQRAIIHYAFIP